MTVTPQDLELPAAGCAEPVDFGTLKRLRREKAKGHQATVGGSFTARTKPPSTFVRSPGKEHKACRAVKAVFKPELDGFDGALAHQRRYLNRQHYFHVPGTIYYFHVPDTIYEPKLCRKPCVCRTLLGEQFSSRVILFL